MNKIYLHSYNMFIQHEKTETVFYLEVNKDNFYIDFNPEINRYWITKNDKPFGMSDNFGECLAKVIKQSKGIKYKMIK